VLLRHYYATVILVLIPDLEVKCEGKWTMKEGREGKERERQGEREREMGREAVRETRMKAGIEG
jgi:hypothetical protein